MDGEQKLSLCGHLKKYSLLLLQEAKKALASFWITLCQS